MPNRPQHLLALAAVLSAIFASAPAFGQEFSEADLEFFERRVRPILANNCFECHGTEEQEADLRLDARASVLIGGENGPVAVPGKPAESRLIEAIGYGNVDLQMPPEYKLPDDKIAILTQWVEMGLPWPEEEAPEAVPQDDDFDLEARRKSHWAWQPIERADPPQVAGDWPSNSIDNFILAKLQANELEPAPPANRRTLVRRLYFDLIGLPPSPEEVEDFVNDGSPDAYGTVVDRLLASPHFGERWGRHWLDLMRYAESYGHEQDYPIRHAWKYRDYVIRALNADVPYDRFITEHIAGDLIETPRRHPEEDFNESIIGTGFWHLSQATHSPVDVRQDESDRVDNQIDVFSKAFLGLTVSCARCHDHKFDAIAAKDYYSLAGFLQSSRRQTAFLDPGGKIEAARRELELARAWGNVALNHQIRDSASRTKDSLGRYLLAANEVMHGRWKATDGTRVLKPSIMFEDFEDGTYHNWYPEGDAFDFAPRKGGNGTRVARSDLDGTRSTGKLTSIPFLIERTFIQFEIAGGDHEGETCINLLVDGEVVRTATGSERRPFDRQWDVSEFMGRIAEIEIVDQYEGSRGTITVDNILFTEDLHRRPIRRPIEAVSGERDIESETLDRWVDALQDPSIRGKSHPLYMWNRAMTGLRARRDEADKVFSKEIADGHLEAVKEVEAAAASTTLFEDFEDGDFGDWFVTGEAFGVRPTKAGEWAPTLDEANLPPAGVAHSGLVSNRLQGVLRSPTFTIPKKNIHYRAAGKRGKIRLVIEGYQLREFNPLLFADTLLDVNTGGDFIWLNQTRDMSKFVGRSAYIELIDEGDGYIAVDEIRFSDGAPARSTLNSLTTALAYSHALGGLDSIESLAAAYQSIAYDAMLHWGETQSEAAGTPLIRWMVENGLADLEAGYDRIDRYATMIADASRELPAPMRVIAMAESTPKDQYVFIRGSYKNAGEVAPRRFLEALAGTDQPKIIEGSGRYELARRLFDPSNPLPARVMANRLWQHLFGRGIVATVDNFGVLGEPPTHPELLDYLAVRFREDGWSVKNLIRLIVSSSTYRMSSKPVSDIAEAKDPANYLLHRMRVRRLEGESIRDAVLAVSGVLDAKFFGAPVPVRLTAFMDGRNRPQSGPVDGEGRRSIYLSLRRNFLAPMMLVFDMPVPDTTTGRRNVSNVPAQALMMMNDPFFIEQAGRWGRKIQEEYSQGQSWGRSVEKIYLAALGRKPTPLEKYRTLVFMHSQAEEYGLSDNDYMQSELLWSDLCHVMFTLKEFVFIG